LFVLYQEQKFCACLLLAIRAKVAAHETYMILLELMPQCYIEILVGYETGFQKPPTISRQTLDANRNYFSWLINLKTQDNMLLRKTMLSKL